MTDPKAQADAIDPLTLADRLETQAMATARASQMLADDKTIRNRLAGDTNANYQGVSKVNTLEWQAAGTIRTLLSRIEELQSERDDWKLQFDLLKEECEQLSIHAALAGKMAIEQCRAVIRYRASVGAPTSETFEALDAKLDSLSKPIDRNALIERGARVMWIDTTDKDYWDHLDDDTRNIYRSNARAILSAWIGEETK